MTITLIHWAMAVALALTAASASAGPIIALAL